MDRSVEKVEVDREEFFNIIRFVSQKYPYWFSSEHSEWLSPFHTFFYFRDKLLGYAVIPKEGILEMAEPQIPETSEFYLEENLYEQFKEEAQSSGQEHGEVQQASDTQGS